MAAQTVLNGSVVHARINCVIILEENIHFHFFHVLNVASSLMWLLLSTKWNIFLNRRTQSVVICGFYPLSSLSSRSNLTSHFMSSR